MTIVSVFGKNNLPSIKNCHFVKYNTFKNINLLEGVKANLLFSVFVQNVSKIEINEKLPEGPTVEYPLTVWIVSRGG